MNAEEAKDMLRILKLLVETLEQDQLVELVNILVVNLLVRIERR